MLVTPHLRPLNSSVPVPPLFDSSHRSFSKRASSTRIPRKLPDGGAVSSVAEDVDDWVWGAWKKRAWNGQNGEPRAGGVIPFTSQNGTGDCWNVTDEECYNSHGHGFSGLDILAEPSLGLKGRQIQQLSLMERKDNKHFEIHEHFYLQSSRLYKLIALWTAHLSSPCLN